MKFAMKSFEQITFALVFATVIFLSFSTQAQGQGMLDANTRVGSGGSNSPIKPARLNSQLYITGQVTGLSRFRGTVPYRAANELHLDLPSASLSRFIQQSIGPRDIRGGRNYATSAYYDRSRTTPTMSAITRGNTIGRFNNTAASSASLRGTLLSDVTKIYAPEYSTSPTSPFANRSNSYTKSAFSVRNVPSPTALGANSLFGLSHAKDRYHLAKQIANLDSEKLPASNLSETGLDTEPIKPMVKPVDTSMNESAKNLPAPDEDVFIDILRSLKSRRSADDTITPPDKDEEGKTKPKILTPTGTKVGFSPRQDLVIHSLAGKGNDQFNRQMRSGEFLLRNGRYYSAEAAFRDAKRGDAANPLASVGAGLALFGAGEPVSASRQLQTAYNMFPALMQTRMDATQIIPLKDLSQQIRLLKSQLSGKQSGNLDLLFLSTFINQNTGQFSRARADAIKLHKAAKANKLLSSYAQQILQTRKIDRTSEPATKPDDE